MDSENSIMDKLFQLPDKYQTYEMFLESINERHFSLSYVPDRFKTDKLCMAALKKNKDNFRFFPEDLKKRIKDIL